MNPYTYSLASSQACPIFILWFVLSIILNTNQRAKIREAWELGYLQPSLELVGTLQHKFRVSFTVHQTPFVHHVVGADGDE